MQGRINGGRHTDHPAGRHSIQTNQCPPPPSPIFYRPDALPAAQPTVSKHWKQQQINKDDCLVIYDQNQQTLLITLIQPKITYCFGCIRVINTVFVSTWWNVSQNQQTCFKQKQACNNKPKDVTVQNKVFISSVCMYFYLIKFVTFFFPFSFSCCCYRFFLVIKDFQ